MKQRIRCSYFEAFYIIRGYLPLAFITVLPSLIVAPESVIEIVVAYGFNILLASAILFFGILQVKSKELILISHIYKKKNSPEKLPSPKTARSLLIKKGVFFKKRSKVPVTGAESVIIGVSPFSAFLKKCRVTLNLGAQGRKGRFVFFTGRKNGKVFVSKLRGTSAHEYKADIIKIIIMAVSGSNAFAGLVFFVPFLSKTGQLFGKYYSELVYKSVDLSPYIRQTGLPPALSSLAGFLLAGLAVSFVLTVINYGGFRFFLSRSLKYLVIVRGWIYKTVFIASVSKIGAYQLRQSLLMRLFSMWSVGFFVSGQGLEHRGKRVLVPATEKQLLQGIGEKKNYKYCENGFYAQPPKRGRRAYLYFPVALIGIIGLLSALGELLPFEPIPLYPLTAFLLIVFSALYFTRIFAFKRAFLYFDGEKAVVSYFKRLTYTVTVVPADKIRCVRISQSLPQRHSGLCSTAIYVYGENKRRFIIKHLEFNRGMEFSEFFSSQNLQ